MADKKESTVEETIQGIVGLIIIIGGLYWFFSSDDTSTPTEDVSYYMKYKDKQIGTLLNPSSSTILSEIAKDYTDDYNITGYKKTLYDCLGNLVWDKEETYTVDKMIGWCMDDYKKGKRGVYYNTAELMSGFSSWDGSYGRLEDVIKKNMNDPSSYEHVKTTYRLVYYGAKRPHMIVNTVFRGNNAFGGKVINNASVKIDAITYEGYDLKMEN